MNKSLLDIIKKYALGAIEALDRVIEFNPDDVGAYNERGLAKDEIGDYGGATQDFAWAIEVAPENVDAYFYRRLSKAELGDHAAAIRQSQQRAAQSGITQSVVPKFNLINDLINEQL